MKLLYVFFAMATFACAQPKITLTAPAAVEPATTSTVSIAGRAVTQCKVVSRGNCRRTLHGGARPGFTLGQVARLRSWAKWPVRLPLGGRHGCAHRCSARDE